MPQKAAPPSSALAALLRWEERGGTWAVLNRSPRELTISLRTCTAGEEVERLTSDDTDLAGHVGDRVRSEE
ncbi:hypothetical protein [Pseudactinotalea sp.]|uniref:hypothetical protein n=1 Tax=Pseudactinotalea sp. TaxID=1926260 RepID=UPI003B3B2D6C